MNPGNVRVDVQSSSFSSMAGPDTQQEPWFGMPYVSSPIAPALLTQWGSTPPSPELQLPPKNDFIPTDFSLRSDDTATASTSRSSETTRGTRRGQQQQSDKSAQVGEKHSHNGSAVGNGQVCESPEHSSFPTPPEMICDEPGLRLWHKLDRQFQTPKAAAYFCLTSAAMYESPAAAAATHLLMKLLEDALCETAYLADVAGLSYDVSVDPSFCMAALQALASQLCYHGHGGKSRPTGIPLYVLRHNCSTFTGHPVISQVTSANIDMQLIESLHAVNTSKHCTYLYTDCL